MERWGLSIALSLFNPSGSGVAQESGVLWLPVGPRAGGSLRTDVLPVRRPTESPALHPSEHPLSAEDRQRQPVWRYRSPATERCARVCDVSQSNLCLSDFIKQALNRRRTGTGCSSSRKPYSTGTGLICTSVFGAKSDLLSTEQNPFTST